MEEVKKELNKMKDKRPPGPGNIPAELLKCGGYALIERLIA